MNRPAAGPQALRNIPGNVFQSQQPSAPRANSLGGSRLQQNGKMGSGSGWAFGGGLANAATPQNSQARPGASSMTSFAQTIGGAQNQASLDPSMPPKARKKFLPLDLGPPLASTDQSQPLTLDDNAPNQPSTLLDRPPWAHQGDHRSVSGPAELIATGDASSASARAATLPTLHPSRQPQGWVPASAPRRLSRSFTELFMKESAMQQSSTSSRLQHSCSEGQQAVAVASPLFDHELRTASQDPRLQSSVTPLPFHLPTHDSRTDQRGLLETSVMSLEESFWDALPPMSNPGHALPASLQHLHDLHHASAAAAAFRAYKRTPPLTNQTNSEFPSLSGAPQAQQQNPSAIWSSQNLRANSAQRQQTQTPSHSQQASLPPHPQQAQRGADQQEASSGGFPALGNGGNGVDDLRFDDRATISRPSRTPGQQGSGDDFPPLGGLGDADLRQATATQPRFNGAGSGLYGQQQQQSQVRGFGQDAPIEGLAAPSAPGNLMSSSNIGSGAPSQTRSLADNGMDGQNSFPRPTQGLGGRLPQGAGLDSFALPHRGPPPSQGQPIGGESTSTATADSTHRELQQMGEVDRWGLPGYLAQLKSNFQDHVGLRLGMDLNTLGLDLHRPEPLWSEWAGPFASSQAHPIVPDFRLPAAYSVHNVPPLHTKISSFSDETLFAIFYGCPRDVSQELAATELYARDWRWHKKMQQWMMKAKEFGEPVQLPSNKEERGWYYFFDVHNWRRERKEFILNYEHLYHGHAGTQMP